MIDGAFMTPGLHFHDSDTPLTHGRFERRGKTGPAIAGPAQQCQAADGPGPGSQSSAGGETPMTVSTCLRPSRVVAVID